MIINHKSLLGQCNCVCHPCVLLAFIYISILILKHLNVNLNQNVGLDQNSTLYQCYHAIWVVFLVYTKPSINQQQ